MRHQSQQNRFTLLLFAYFNTNIKMMLKLKYFLIVTLYFQLFNVESAPLEPITVSVVSALIGLAGTGTGVANLYVNLASSGCWPKTIHSQQVLGKFHQKMEFELD